MRIFRVVVFVLLVGGSAYTTPSSFGQPSDEKKLPQFQTPQSENSARAFADGPPHVPIRVVDGMIIVPVMVNEKGPFDFLLDTGSTSTTVDEKFAAEVGLVPVGRSTITSLQSGSRTVLAEKAEIFSVGAAEVHPLRICVLRSLPSVHAKVRGILGENFLDHFDLLVDYQHHFLQLESTSGSLAGTLAGERIPIELPEEDRPGIVNDRLVLSVRIPALTPNRIRLLLDSGTSTLIVYGYQLQLRNLRATEVLESGNLPSSQDLGASWEKVGWVLIGKRCTFIDRPALVTSIQKRFDTDGVLPASAFQGIFISHSGKFAILNPVAKSALSLTTME